MKKYEAVKASGSGNTFIILWCTKSEKYDNLVKRFWRYKKKYDFSIDGFIILLPSLKIGIDIRMKVFNPDGIATPMCLNGIRCAARLVYEKFGYDNERNVFIESDSGIFNISRIRYNQYQVHGIKSIHYEKYKNSESYTGYTIDSNIPYKFTYVSVYTPYILTQVEMINENQLLNIGIKANNLKQQFPIGINVSFVKKISETKLFVKTFERGGIGLSLSCSSSMIAAVYMMVMGNECPWNDEITVYNQGGLVKISIKNVNNEISATLIGDAIFEDYRNIIFDENNDSFDMCITSKTSEVEENISYTNEIRKQCGESTFLIAGT